MKTYNYTFQNNHFINEIDYDLFKDEKNILIQVFCGNEESTLQFIVNMLHRNIPNAICIGTTTDGEIKDGKVSTLKTVVSISVFDNTIIKKAISKNKDSFSSGYEIAKKLITNNTKLIITFTDGTKTNAEEYLKGISNYNNSIMVCGGMAGDNGVFKDTFISFGKKVFKHGAVAVSLNSDVLKVFNNYKYDWSPIGIEHTIEKAEGNRVYRISGMTASKFYEKYLGKNNSHAEFPLIVRRDNKDVARAVLTKYPDGSLGAAGNLYEGEKIRLGFANAQMIIKNPIKYKKNIENYAAETFFIYSCMARRRYMQNLIKVEIEPFSQIAPTSGFFTYGEFMHTNKKNRLMNETITLVGLTENSNLEKVNLSSKQHIVKHNETSYAQTIQSLTSLIQQSAKDQIEQSKILEREIEYSQNLLKNQKQFLSHAVHETNTPLSVIMCNIDLHNLEYKKNEYISNIEVAMKNVIAIYDDLSYLVKKNHINYNVHAINFTDFVKSRLFFFERVANEFNSKFIFQTDKEDIKLIFNETKLQRIVDNTLTNAIKYTYKNKPIIVKLYLKNKNPQFVVSSHSKKIQYPKKVFEEYYREKNSQEGTGLGLNLVKKICDEEGVIINLISNSELTSFTYIFKGK